MGHTVVHCVQEIVTNAVRHSGARNLWIELRAAEDGLRVVARDDGRGVARVQPMSEARRHLMIGFSRTVLRGYTGR